MASLTKSTAAESERAYIPRPRSLPYRKPYAWAMLWAAVHYLCVLGLLACIVLFAIHRNERASQMLAAAVVCCMVTWLIAFFKRRKACCPLCKGTPLLSSGALTHGKAVRAWPLNHGVTATLSLLGTQQFRCMYCGNHYDFLKPPAGRN